jgi:FkbM family methyltransferase
MRSTSAATQIDRPSTARTDSMQYSLKERAQGLLRSIGLYHRIKSSLLYDLYWMITDRKLIDNRNAEIEFYRKTLVGLKKKDLVFDIGANTGYKTNMFLKLGAQVVAVEPDKLNQEILRQSFLNYRLIRKPLAIIGKAVSDKIGWNVMWIHEPGSAMNTLNPKWAESLKTDDTRFGTFLRFDSKVEVETTTLEELVRLHGRPFYVKIDVEGHEASVLKGLRSIVPFVSFEINLPQFQQELFQCIELLEGLAPGGHFNYTSEVLRGLTLDEWLLRAAFVNKLSKCEETCIEVFWRAPRIHRAAITAKPR